MFLPIRASNPIGNFIINNSLVLAMILAPLNGQSLMQIMGCVDVLKLDGKKIASILLLGNAFR